MATGEWVIVSTHPYSDITALSFAEAHAYIGKKVSVSDHRVVYAGKSCEVAKEDVTYSVGQNGDDRGFPYSVVYGCQDKTFIPGFSIGKSCSRIRSGEDGWTFGLRRVKAK
jgi:hypothetical protein